MASFLVHDISSSHDLTNRERLFVKSAQDIVSIIQHAFSLTITSHGALLTVRKLIFRRYTLYLVRLDAVSKTSVRLDRHTLNDGVNLWHLDLRPPLVLDRDEGLRRVAGKHVTFCVCQERDFWMRRQGRQNRHKRDGLSAETKRGQSR